MTYTNSRYDRYVLTLTLMAAAAFAPAAPAATVMDPEAPLSVHVRLADLDTSSDAGREALYQRLHAAARYVCHPLEDRSVRGLSSWHACLRTTMDTAVRQVNQPGLTALHLARTHRAPDAWLTRTASR